MRSHAEFAVAVLLLCTVVVRSAEETCRDQATCGDFSVQEAAQASAMMQVKSQVVTSVPTAPKANVGDAAEAGGRQPDDVTVGHGRHDKNHPRPDEVPKKHPGPPTVDEIEAKLESDDKASESGKEKKKKKKHAQAANTNNEEANKGDAAEVASAMEDAMAAAEAAEASAMMQRKGQVVTFAPAAPKAGMNISAVTSKAVQWQAAHLKQSRSCLPQFLEEFHSHWIRQNAAGNAAPQAIDARQLASAKALQELGDEEDHSSQVHKRQAHKPPPSLEDQTASPTTKAPTTQAPTVVTEAPDSTEDSVRPSLPLDAEGFKATTILCCPEQMEAFFNRLLDSLGYDVCSIPHVQGLMHWFTCVPDMDFQYVLDVIQDGNPCKYWGPEGQTCPTLTEQCAGSWCR